MKIETVLVNIILDIERTMKTKKYLRFYAALTVLKERIATFNDASLIAERVEQLKVLYTSPEYDQFVNELKETEEELRRLKRSARIVQKGMKRVHPTLVEAAETIVRFNSWCEKNIPVTGFLGKKHPLIQAQQEERAACLANNVKQLKKLFLQERERNLALIEMMRSV